MIEKDWWYMDIYGKKKQSLFVNKVRKTNIDIYDILKNSPFRYYRTDEDHVYIPIAKMYDGKQI